MFPRCLQVPSWCDRVLWKSLPGFVDDITPTLYEACTAYKTSDHKPIRAGFAVGLPAPLPPVGDWTQVVHLVFTGLSAEILREMWPEVCAWGVGQGLG